MCCGAEHGTRGMGCPGCSGGPRAVGSSEPLQGPAVDPLGSLVADLGQPRAWAGSAGLSIKLAELCLGPTAWNDSGVGNDLCFPSVLADSSQIFCLKSFLLLPSRSSCFLPHVLAVPAVLSLSRVSLGCILHCPNSPKFRVFRFWGCVQLTPTRPS